MAIKPSLLRSKIMHARLTPKKNSFVYKQYHVLLEAGRDWAPTPSLFSINRFNLFSFFFKKYGKLNGENPYDYAVDQLTQAEGDTSWLSRVFALTQPSLLGWSFNPVSFWFYLDDQDQLRAVLVEVNNTFGEHHKYFAHHDDFSVIFPEHTLKSRKMFYVSPFYEVKGDYAFRFNLSEKGAGVWIDYFLDGEKTLLTSVAGKFRSLTNLNLLQFFIRIPFANLKTPILIHWQALIIWLKGITYVARKDHKNKEVTRCR